MPFVLNQIKLKPIPIIINETINQKQPNPHIEKIF